MMGRSRRILAICGIRRGTEPAWVQGQYGWENLGGQVYGDPCVVSWGPDRLDVFVRGPGNNLYHKWWDGNAWRPDPMGWEFLGGELHSDPAAVAWGPERLDIFVQGPGNKLFHTAWFAGRWQWPWEDLGGWIEGTPVAVLPL